MNKFLYTTIAFALLALLAACAQNPAERGPVNEQGLTTLTHSTFDTLAIRSSTDFSQYRKFKVEPLTVSYDDIRRNDALNRKKSDFEFDEREMELLDKQFNNALSSSWGDRFGWEITEESGDDVVVVKAKLTNLYLYASIKNNNALPTRAATNESSRMVISLDLVDSQSGELLLQSSGKKTTGQRGSGVQTMSRVSSVSYWNDAFQAFRQWGNLLATQIEDIAQ